MELYDMSAGAALLLSILLQCASVFAVKVSYTCHETTVADKEFRLNFRLDPESNTDITGVKTYVSPTVLTSPECSATLSGGIYELSTTIDVGTSECGTVNYYEIQCDTPSLLKSTVKTSEFQTSAVKSNYMHRPNPTDVKFQVVEADGSYVPTSNVYEGQDIKLRLIYNKGAIEYGPQNLGYVFHTGSTPHFGETELIIQIMTPGLGTEVKIEGQLDGNEFIYYSKVKRDSALLPSHNSAERYVLFYPPSFDNSYTMVDPVDDQRVSFLTPGGLEQKGGSTENYNYFDKKRSQFSGFTGDAFEIMSDNPIAWGVRQYFYATEGRKYDLYFVAYKTDMAEIKLKLGTITTSFTGPSLGDAASFSTNRADVPRVQGETGVRFEYFFLLDFEVEDTDAFAIESGLVEFRSRRPFMLMIIEKAADGKLRQAYSPWDDDGAINGDTNVDEDLALGEIYERGIEVDKLVFDVLGSFGSSNMETVISGGCNTEAEIFSDIGTFSHNTDLSSLFDDYWVLDSETFDAFKITSESDVYFQVEYDVCYDGDLETTCANPTCRKRRSSDRKKEGSGRRAITSLKLHRNDSTEIKDAIREEKPEYEKDDIIFGHPCFSSVEFWTRVGGLLAIILMEASMIGGMLAYKRRVLNSFK
ncbi:hypothetical protein MAR_006853 [Mya arenaria]|uniref:Uncharacterized protein n=1 Tax=Mya arenaria TaxID=6604 RepID=A0ABY7DC96_MYAAR|nr:hypothetical protein MAR_006853 [Mya arenaria]